MTWFKVDDGLAFHAKTIAAGNAAMGLWVRAGAWSAQHLSDGYVPDHVVLQIGTARQAASLVSSGLWRRCDGGYAFHEWESYQPSKGSVEERRRRTAEKLRRWRETRSDTM